MGLDTVELVLGWEEAFGVPISDEAARDMRTTADVIDYLYPQVKGDLPEDTGCLAVRAFFRLRGAFRQSGCQGVRIRPDTKVSQLLPGKDRRDRLTAILQSVGFTPPGRLPLGLQFTAASIGTLVVDAVVRDHRVLRIPGCGWSRRQVREVVRAVMNAQLSLRKFSDKARIVKDLGVM